MNPMSASREMEHNKKKI
jgi:hypothetical protein